MFYFLIFIGFFIQHFFNQTDPDLLYDPVVCEQYLFYTFSALVWLQKVSNQLNARGNEINELGTYVREVSFQSIKHTVDENSFSEDVAEKCPDLFRSSLFSERGVEENCFKQIEQLYLGDKFLVGNRVAERFGERGEDELNEMVAYVRVINVID